MNICLAIGSPIKSSRSPSIHNAAYKALGIDDQFLFLRVEVKPENLKSTMEEVKRLGLNKKFPLQISGMSITMPHKQAIIKYLDSIDKDAAIIGAVNTIVNQYGKLKGYNTDWIGAIVALEKKTQLNKKSVAVIGAGGAARAIVFGLTKKHARVKIFNRSLDHAKALAKEFNCEYAGLDTLNQVSKMDIIVNATSVGMNEDKSPIDGKFLNSNQVVFDIVYSPKETKLIKSAKKKGTKIVYGFEMLLYQAIPQIELYTGMKPSFDIMKKAFESYE